MARVEKSVFISYRRKDISWALAVYQDLTHQGYDVFFDYSSIPSGDFEQIIISNIKARAHFVLILTPTTLDRCGESGDWLRREIETAMDEKRNIIPLFFDGFSFGAAGISEKLTGKLQNISRYNGMNVHQDYFREAMERLRTQFLKVPLDAVLHPVSTEVQKVVREEQRAANVAARKAKANLTEKKKKDQREFTGRVFDFVSSNSRRFGIGGIVLLILILGGFGLNRLINNQPAPIVTASPTITETPKPPAATKVSFTPTLEPTKTLVPAPTLGIGSMMTGEKDGMMSAYIPAGEFTMGSPYGDEDLQPAHKVYLDAFWIDQTEVTNAMYAKCVDGGGCNPPINLSYFENASYANHPVVYVDYNQATGYCEWAGRRLPTEAEWEKSARGTDGRTLPWGNELDCDKANYYGCVGATSPVGSYERGRSPYGVFDMTGNVWEWVNDYYQSDYYSTLRDGASNPQGPASGTLRVARGGSWGDVDQPLLSSDYRAKFPPAYANGYLGFRCARTP